MLPRNIQKKYCKGFDLRGIKGDQVYSSTKAEGYVSLNVKDLEGGYTPMEKEIILACMANNFLHEKYAASGSANMMIWIKDGLAFDFSWFEDFLRDMNGWAWEYEDEKEPYKTQIFHYTKIYFKNFFILLEGTKAYSTKDKAEIAEFIMLRYSDELLSAYLDGNEDYRAIFKKYWPERALELDNTAVKLSEEEMTQELKKREMASNNFSVKAVLAEQNKLITEELE